MYLLASRRMGTIYIGVTADLIARLGQHRGGQSEFTARYGVTSLVRYELFADMPSAIAREKQLKRWHREWKIGLIERDNPEWIDLAVTLRFPFVRDRVGRDGS
ncbi:GIY-YIG nuclease family protein [Sphingomonas hominis]|uniref:GIY-YIG nuclease family protein n=1 Tax=Sphingomonas hominis TaxID=2741495 RepID=UPI003CCDC705